MLKATCARAQGTGLCSFQLAMTPHGGPLWPEFRQSSEVSNLDPSCIYGKVTQGAERTVKISRRAQIEKRPESFEHPRPFSVRPRRR